jgi:hypothetical protein
MLKDEDKKSETTARKTLCIRRIPTGSLKKLPAHKDANQNNERAQRARVKKIGASQDGYVYQTTVIFECKVCQATSEFPSQKVKEAIQCGKQGRPVCHNNKFHGMMEPIGNGKYFQLASWVR